MKEPLVLGVIPEKKYSEYRYNAIFQAYKWDPQVEDHNTVAKQVILMNADTAAQLERWAEQLAAETALMEEALLKKLSLARNLGLPREIIKTLNRLQSYDRENNIRLMRFDFHPTETGWAVSEVNSDVPGGLAEASILPELAMPYFDGYKPRGHLADSLFKSFQRKIKEKGTLAFVHATSYSDDRQVMEFLSDYAMEHGYQTVFIAPDHIQWKKRKANNILQGSEGEVDGIIRFFPLEWMKNLPRNVDWKGYYNSETPSCNHPISILAQSKRLPLIWDELGVEIPAWKTLLPETIDPKAVKRKNSEWIYKPAFGRVGEDISIREAISEKEYIRIEKAANRHSKDWVAQRKFNSCPLKCENGEIYHVCIGVFAVDGKSAGFYGRISPYPRIDGRAKDIPILVSS